MQAAAVVEGVIITIITQVAHLLMAALAALEPVHIAPFQLRPDRNPAVAVVVIIGLPRLQTPLERLARSLLNHMPDVVFGRVIAKKMMLFAV